MDATRRQFMLCYAVMGAVLAYLPELLFQRLGSNEMVGYIMSTTGLAIIVTPVIMTALADTRLQSRTILAVLYAAAAGACLWMAGSDSFIALMIAYGVFAFVFWPQSALQDGLVFARNRQRLLRGEPEDPYHRIRIYGTLGYALPLVVIYFLLDAGMSLSVTLWTGAVVCVLGVLNSTTLSRIELSRARQAKLAQPDPVENNPVPIEPTKRFPTLAAARVLFRGPGLIFCIGMFIVQLPNAAYYTFYPVYLTDQIGFDEKWIGPIVMIGVFLELGLMLSVGWMTRWLGLKWVLVLGLACMSLRMALLGLFPTPLVAVGTQVFHGITIIGLYVIPPIFLNTLAGDHFRNSVQGLYIMIVFGPARILGPIFTGILGDLSLLMMFHVSAGITLFGTLLLACFLNAKPQSTGQPIEEHAEATDRSDRG